MPELEKVYARAKDAKVKTTYKTFKELCEELDKKLQEFNFLQAELLEPFMMQLDEQEAEAIPSIHSVGDKLHYYVTLNGITLPTNDQIKTYHEQIEQNSTLADKLLDTYATLTQEMTRHAKEKMSPGFQTKLKRAQERYGTELIAVFKIHVYPNPIITVVGGTPLLELFAVESECTDERLTTELQLMTIGRISYVLDYSPIDCDSLKGLTPTLPPHLERLKQETTRSNDQKSPTEDSAHTTP